MMNGVIGLIFTVVEMVSLLAIFLLTVAAVRLARTSARLDSILDEMDNLH
jgi:hypothetical protein